MIGATARIALIVVVALMAIGAPASALAAPSIELPWPAGEYHRIASGYTYGCGTHTGSNRYAIDFEFSEGQAIAAAAWGTVVDRTLGYNGGQGNFVRIDHGGGYKSRYLHMTETFGAGIYEGGPVAQNQIVGYADDSGDSDGDHLHFDLKLNDAAYKPEPMSGQTSFGSYGRALVSEGGSGCSSWTASPSWTSHGWYSWQDWGPVWGQPQLTELANAVALQNPNYVGAHTAAVRVNRYGEGAGYNLEFREYTGSGWPNWLDINLWPSDPLFDGKAGISNRDNQINVVGISTGNVWYRKRVSGSWNSWGNLGYPGGVIFNAASPVAVTNSGGRIGIVAISSAGNVYFKRYQSGWASWVSLGGGGTLGGAIAIATRPNGIYSVAAFRPVDATVWTNCSTNGTSWTGWTNLGGMLADSLGIDNSGATNCVAPGSDPGVHVVAFNSLHTMMRCWASYCLPGYWQDLGEMFGGPTAVANTNGQVHVVTRTQWEMMHRARQ